MKKLFIFLLIGLFNPSWSQNSAEVVKNVSAADFKKALDAGKGTLIDLRTSEEITSKGKIKGAIQIDYLSKGAEAEILKLDRNKTYLIYCAGGGRSSECAELMSKNGFKDVIHLTKGFSDWLKSGFEIEKK